MALPGRPPVSEPRATDASNSNRGVLSGRPLGHQPALDGLRGVAVAIVVLSHVPFGLMPPTAATLTFRRWVGGGWLGVDIFFVLSGFLITALLLAETPRIRFAAFYGRRALRLLPALWLMLIIVIGYQHLAQQFVREADYSGRQAFLYTYNWSQAHDPAKSLYSLGHLWSLAVEEQFYLVWPILVAGLVALRRPKIAGLLIVAGITLIALQRNVVFSRDGWLAASGTAAGSRSSPVSSR
jgi:peptidoglycan/LPS O-acetylase OafA/YrhL